MLEPRLLLESEKFWAVNKPPRWLTIEGRDPASKSPVLTVWLHELSGQKPWVVHRLDRDTSGVVVFAKTESAHRELNLAFLGRDVQKVYECLVLGEPNLPDFIVKTPIDGKPSQTRFRLVKSSKGVSLLKAFPKTGRLHQIRKHLAEMGLPILGDTKYAGLSTFQDIEFDRTSLHAQSLKLPGIDLIKAPHFEDFENWLELFNLESKKHDN